MATFASLQTALGIELRDPNALVWDTTALATAINEAVIEVGRIAPDRFQQDITVVANTLTYTLKNGEPETEVRKVEIWDITTTPHQMVMLVQPISQEYSKDSSVGWDAWAGTLYLPNSLVSLLVVGTHLIRVWGYAPYAIVSGATELPMSTELEYAVRAYAKVAALESLLFQRNTFTQWQTDPLNTDLTPAMLIQQLTMARSDWERRAKKIAILRESF